MNAAGMRSFMGVPSVSCQEDSTLWNERFVMLSYRSMKTASLLAYCR
ncbi:MAG: hypothetical protein ACRDQ7_03705 [Haloechinothrix sp.]